MTTGDPDRAVARDVQAAAVAFLLGLVALSPWAFGCSIAPWRLVLALGVFAVSSLWAAHAVLTRRISYTSDAVSLCLLGLILLTAFQLVPLPESVVHLLSPAAADWHRTLVPEVPELLPGESEADVPPRASWLRLSIAPAATEDLLARFLAVFLVYSVARNFVAVPSAGRALRKLAWVAFVAGVGLAVLGLAQYLSGERSRIYWRFGGGRAVFGPFWNKNHFAFQMNLFMGLTGGLFVAVARRPGEWRSPAGLGLLGGLGLMAASVAFSQSRGGLISAGAAAAAVAVAAWFVGRGDKSAGKARAGLVLAVGVAVVAGGLIAWLGWHGVADRFATLWDGQADSRPVDWRSVWPLAERFPLTGVGGGGLIWTEPTVRTRTALGYEFNTLDNDYLEALIEGGIGRFALTIGLGIAAVWAAVAGYRRTGDPLLLGCAFGLAAVAFQSAGDYGLHTPSVALTAAVVAAFGAARGQETGDRRQRPEQPATPVRPESSLTPELSTVHRSLSTVSAALLILAGGVVVLAEWRSQRVATLRTGAALLAASQQHDAAIRYLEAATRIRPNDPLAWNQLMFAHLSAAIERDQTTAAAVAGPVAFAVAPELPSSGNADGHLAAALRAARSGRACQPLNPAFHLVPGTFADYFARSEPPAAYFDRAKSIAAFDADVWYSSGRAAVRRGDWPAALADWREALTRSQKRLAVIVRRTAPRFPPEELRSRLLPDDPAVWLAATPFVFPDAASPGRAEWLRATADRWACGPEPEAVAGFVGWATTLEELGDRAAAAGVWRRAIERFPEDVRLRERLAALLEADELYEEAVSVLEWLANRHPDRSDYRERLAAAHHALKLKAEIDRP